MFYLRGRDEQGRISFLNLRGLWDSNPDRRKLHRRNEAEQALVAWNRHFNRQEPSERLEIEIVTEEF